MRFLRNCFVLAFRDATRAAFGYASFLGGVILAAFGAIWVPSLMSANGWEGLLFRGIVGGASGWLFVFCAYLFLVSPFKAWRTVRPLAIKMGNEKSSVELVQGDLQQHSVHVIIRNCSSLKSIYCKVSIVEATDMNHRMPWPIYTGNIPPSDEHKIELARWFWRKDKQDYPILIFAERQGGFPDANRLLFSQDGAEIVLLAQSQDCPSVSAKYRIFGDIKTEQLILEAMPMTRGRSVPVVNVSASNAIP
jgi:hypothetical protein